MSINENGTGQDRTIALADLPRFDDISAMFEEAQKEPDSKPLGMLQKLTLMTQKIGRRLRGDRTPSEYDTRRVDIPTFRGERYKTAHIKDGQLLSETTTDIQMRRSGSAILKNEVKVTNPFESGDLNRVSSRHSSLTIGQERDQILTEGVTLSNGVSFARTQDFQTQHNAESLLQILRELQLLGDVEN